MASIYLYYGGAQHGPFTASQVSQMRALGALGADTSYWQDGMAEWQTISEFSPM